MSDLVLRWNYKEAYADFVFEAGDLVNGYDLETLVIASLFTDARASEDDEIPEGSSRRGNWMSQYLPDFIEGSLLWLLERELASEKTRQRAEVYATRGLSWMMTANFVDAVTVTAVISGENRIDLITEIVEPSGRQHKYSYAWVGMAERVLS